MSKEYEELIAGVNFRILLDVRDQRIQELEAEREDWCHDCVALQDLGGKLQEAQWLVGSLTKRIEELEAENAELRKLLKEVAAIEPIASDDCGQWCVFCTKYGEYATESVLEDVIHEQNCLWKRIAELEGSEDE